MGRLNIILPTILLLFGIELVANGCGNSRPRLLQSVSVSPASADAQTFAVGQVQFSAVGTYSQPPSPVTLSQAGWSLVGPDIATISQNGLAQCKSGSSGVVTIRASVSAPCSGTGCTAALMSGTAQLSCP